MAHADPLGQLLDRMTSTPALDKFAQVAADIRAAEAEELAEDERRYWARKEVAFEERAAAARTERRREGL